MIDIEKGHRELLRWLILLTLDNARPLGAAEGLILTVVQAVPHIGEDTVDVDDGPGGVARGATRTVI